MSASLPVLAGRSAKSEENEILQPGPPAKSFTMVWPRPRPLRCRAGVCGSAAAPAVVSRCRRLRQTGPDAQRASETSGCRILRLVRGVSPTAA